MSNVPADLHYARTHEWLRTLPDGTVEVGISDHAQHALGDLVFVEVPETGRELQAGDACAVVESVKAASDVYSPVAGTVVAVNAQLSGEPGPLWRGLDPARETQWSGDQRRSAGCCRLRHLCCRRLNVEH